ncbi:unnamed protein product [Mesocestoides corti]|uniref:Uncharacterized protein n=2 Tax=Mesocestoides corti TaxID=53468 RepID=A0A0R3UHF4_MESCO|nr:unnamed protein product [Mesocestoides corti]
MRIDASEGVLTRDWNAVNGRKAIPLIISPDRSFSGPTIYLLHQQSLMQFVSADDEYASFVSLAPVDIFKVPYVDNCTEAVYIASEMTQVYKIAPSPLKRKLRLLSEIRLLALVNQSLLKKLPSIKCCRVMGLITSHGFVRFVQVVLAKGDNLSSVLALSSRDAPWAFSTHQSEQEEKEEVEEEEEACQPERRQRLLAESPLLLAGCGGIGQVWLPFTRAGGIVWACNIPL